MARPVRLPRGGGSFLEIFSVGRGGPGRATRFTPSQVAQIARTARRTPEVMVKVTGGGTSSGAVAAHLSYIGRQGKVELETDEGERVVARRAQRDMLRSWQLDLSRGQYRRQRNGDPPKRPIKLVHNIVLSMPSPTSPEKILAAARAFAREKFGSSNRYAMALHTHQSHPHVHMVVKAEGERGRRLHIDKETLRDWREDFANMLREQGIEANATPGLYRGRGRGSRKYAHMSQPIGLQMQNPIEDGRRESAGPWRALMLAQWRTVAHILESQGEFRVAGDVRHFVRRPPSISWDRENRKTRVAGRAELTAPQRRGREPGSDVSR